MVLLRTTGKGVQDVKNNIRISMAQALIVNESSAAKRLRWLSFEPLCFQEQTVV